MFGIECHFGRRVVGPPLAHGGVQSRAGVAYERSATVAKVANVCGDLRLVTHEQPRMMLPAAFQSSSAFVGGQLRTLSMPPPAP